MTQWTSAVCETNGIHLHYTRTGGDKPPIVLLHGLMTSGACWTPLARELAADYDVLMPDARGHGASGVPDFGYRYDDHADDVMGLVEHLALSSPVLLGHSMGGMTAAVVASRRPAWLRSLVLADPTFMSPAMQRAVSDSDVADRHREILHRSLDEVIADARQRHPHRSAETLAIFARARLQTSLAAFDVLTPPNPDFQQLVRVIAVPTLLVFGDRGVMSEDVAAELRRLQPRLRTESIPDAGHALQFDQPDRFRAAVLQFLNATSRPATDAPGPKPTFF